MKKWMFGVLASVFVFVVLITSLGVVSAADLVEGSNQVIDWIKDFLSPFLEAIFGSPEYIFEKLLFFILVLAISYAALNKSEVFEDNETIIWVVSLAVSLLATRFLTEIGVVQTILLSYSTLGVVLTAAIPLIIFFFFVMSFNNTFTRRILWALFIAVFIGLWNSRADEVGKLAWIYPATALLAFIFLVMDGTLRRTMLKIQMNQLGLTNREEFEREIRRKILEAEDDMRKNIITTTQFKKIRRKLRKKLKALRKM